MGKVKKYTYKKDFKKMAVKDVFSSPTGFIVDRKPFYNHVILIKGYNEKDVVMYIDSKDYDEDDNIDDRSVIITFTKKQAERLIKILSSLK